MVMERRVRIGHPSGAVMHGDLSVPAAPDGIVVFAHGSGSSRHSPRNRMVAAHLQQRQLATLLVDLLTAEEEEVDLRTRQHRFDIPLLARRLALAAAWVQEQQVTTGLPVGYFGASTGAAAALVAAAEQPSGISAIVSRGGRPDLAGDDLERVRAPTLLIVGELDGVVITLNREALSRMRARTSMEIVPRASHLFEEPGALETVARLAGDWFGEHLHTAAASRRSTG